MRRFTGLLHLACIGQLHVKDTLRITNHLQGLLAFDVIEQYADSALGRGCRNRHHCQARYAAQADRPRHAHGAAGLSAWL